MFVSWLSRLTLLASLGWMVVGRAPKLDSYTVDRSQITVSGLSSGAYFAVQFHVAYSRIIAGAGVIAGGPFYCAEDSLEVALHPCMKEPGAISVDELVTITYTSAASLVIDDPLHLKDTRVFLLSGKHDTVVDPGVVVKLQDYYSAFVIDVAADYSVPAEHCFPTEDYGNPCSYLGPPYICNCNYSAASVILSQLYPDLVHNTSVRYNPNNLLQFDQTEFSLGDDDLYDYGYIYVPSACQNSSQKPCKLHIAFHGCLQGPVFLGDEFVTKTGYVGLAEQTDTIVLFPQVTNSTLNPKGCWDWWGYTSPAYASWYGLQMNAIRDMLHRVAGV